MSRSFRVLVRHFFLQFFRVETGTGESGFSMAVALGLLAAPGAIMSFLLFAKYSPLLRWFRRDFAFDMDIASLPDKYTFLALSMTVTGLVVVLRWESLFPDRIDFANLAPLPVHSRTVLVAKTVALAGFVALFLFCVNVCPTVLFPLIALESKGEMMGALRFIGSHAVASVAAGVWAFSAFLMVTGACMSLLPFALFRRVRRVLQFTAISVLLLLFLSASTMAPAIDAFRMGTPVWAEWLPPAWFLGLYQQLQGKAAGSFTGLAARALQSLAVTSSLAALFYALSFRRYYLRSAETSEGSTSAFPVPVFLLRRAERALAPGLYRASFRFALRTLARSDRHTAAFTAIVGLGFALAVQSFNLPAQTSPVPIGQLAGALMIVYAVLTGLRLCFGIPSDTAANWIFRLGPEDEHNEPRSVVQLVMYVFLVPAVLLPAVAFAFLYGWKPALLHVVCTMAISSITIDRLTAGFCVLPFTCSWLPGRGNVIFAVALWTIGLLAFSHAFAALDLFLMQDTQRVLVFAGIAAACLYGLSTAREDREVLVWADTRGELDLLRIGE